MSSHKRVKTLVSKDAILFFDGASKGNPGVGGGGWILQSSKKTLAYGWYYLPNCTNNEAEYCGLIEGLRCAKSLNLKNIEFRGDSKLVINQVLGNWKCKAINLIPLKETASALLKMFKRNGLWIPRKENFVADLLSNLSVKEKGEFVSVLDDELVDVAYLEKKHL